LLGDCAVYLLSERAKKLVSVRAELAKNAPPIDFAASFYSLDIMEKVMRHFYLRALIEERMGVRADWNAVAQGPGGGGESGALSSRATLGRAPRRRHQRYRDAYASLDELLDKIKDELRKLGPLIDLEAIREPQGSRTEGGSTVGSRTIEND
jgi:hypothetical protein